MPKYFGGGGGGGGGAVSSVFGRIGAVVALLGDYTTSLIGNTSDVPGTTAQEALNNVKDMPNVNVATTGNVALTGVQANVDAGVTLVSGVTLILVWLQTNPNENGVYVYNSGGAWTRAPEYSAAVNFRVAQPFEVLGGTLWGGRLAWVKLAPTTVGASPIIFNIALNIAQPTADSQTLQYRASDNSMQPAGIKTFQLGDSNANIDLSQGSCFQLNVPLTANRTLVLQNTGATNGRIVTFDIRVTLGFTLTINNPLSAQLLQFPAGAKWFGSASFTGQWSGVGFQEAV